MNWRSLLYVPATSERFLGKAQDRGADALILDLEDSVPEDRKSEARERLAAAWETLRDGPSDLLVRVNGDLCSLATDLESVLRPGLRALYVPKAESASRLEWIADSLDRLEMARGLAPRSVGLVPLIETPTALEAAFEIAQAPRVVALSLGSEDIATACGMTPTPDNLRAARQRIVMAARAAAVSPLGLLETAATLDAEAMGNLAARSRAAGFAGAAIVHPSGIAALNRGFLPGREELDWAREVIAALDRASAQGLGAARVGGRMIDRPMRRRAEGILAAASRHGPT